ncbi:signal peptidase I [Deinococcus misasensis]|uniref:signal peptidase I n=1 Tax=Deinococcus misasensis TaxID=392413 RepID=UPI00068E81EC|nr:signal peptidase I [Deinococcus misasensis]
MKKTLLKIWDAIKEFVIVIALTTFVVSFPGVSGNSMMPTLRTGERMVIPKYETWMHRMGIGSFQRGDIVVFKPPADHKASWRAFPTDQMTLWHFIPYYVKRVVAVSGDTVRIEEGRVYVNNKEVDFQTIENYWQAQGCWDNSPESITANFIRADAEKQLVKKTFKVPEGEYFLMGDNRSEYGSSDSRAFGSVPLDRIAGRVGYIVFPFWRKTNASGGCDDQLVNLSGGLELNLRQP